MTSLTSVSFFFALFLVSVTCVCTAAPTATVGRYGVVHKSTTDVVPQGTPCPEEQVRKERMEKLDKEKLLYNGKVVVDKDPKMLEPPEPVKPWVGKVITIAKTAPEIEFAVIPVRPMFLNELHVQPTSSGWWASYCQAMYHPGNGKFYTTAGDHGTYQPHIYLVEYDPATRTVKCLPEINRSLGKQPGKHFGDGIHHGYLDIFQSKHLSRPHLWLGLYWAKFPEPAEEDYATGYDGGHILSYDFETGDYVDYGPPLYRASYPYHCIDRERGMMYFVSCNSEFVAWDINEEKVRWAGYLPEGLKWYNRALLVDEKTGWVFTCNADPSDKECHIIKYDPKTNRFTKMNSAVPLHPKTGKSYRLRANERGRGPDGLIWCVTSAGQLFTFDPENDKVEDKGVNWPEGGSYSCCLERSPGGRYLYYPTNAIQDGTPIMQFDTKTGTRKVLAFVRHFYEEKYGYLACGAYTVKLDEKGEKLFVNLNGTFMDYDPSTLGLERFGLPSVMLIHIPASERVE